jgi:hypothetical protein
MKAHVNPVDLSKYAPYIIEHKSEKNKLYCTLTKDTLNRDAAELDRHVEGYAYIVALSDLVMRRQKKREQRAKGADADADEETMEDEDDDDDELFLYDDAAKSESEDEDVVYMSDLDDDDDEPAAAAEAEDDEDEDAFDFAAMEEVAPAPVAKPTKRKSDRGPAPRKVVKRSK